MKKMLFAAAAIVIFLMGLPVIALISATNISALASAAVSLFTSPKVTSDAYDYGECTYWVALRRLQIKEPIPNTWGNAITWASRATADNYLVNHTPSFGAIMQDSNAPGGLGHVAFVQSVNPITGAWTISEMNRVGWDEVDTRTLPATAANKYNFIHQPIGVQF
ncbi:CHAP domain-containing protein [Patescibacteria group bacterium]|jgi:surface antigen|nr:CHAP domain-containing protein [Patescibacteria group bacterium]